MSDRAIRIVAIPASGHAYMDCFYEACRRRGARVVEGVFAGGWLRANLRRGDVVHLHWPSFSYAAPGWVGTIKGGLRFTALMLLIRALGGRIVWTAHNLYPHDPSVIPGFDRVMRLLLTRLSARILCHGPTAAALVRREFGVRPQQLAVIPHGHWVAYYPDDLSRVEARNQLGLPEDAWVYLFIGLCKPYKNLEQLLRAFAIMPAGCSLVIAGKFQDPEYRARVSSLAAGIPGVKLFEGYVPDERLQVFLNAADCVVLPYRDILTSGAAMLAHSFGCPVVAPRAGSLIDLVDGRCGVLYDGGAEGLVGAMNAVRSLRFDPAAIREHASGYRWEDAADILLGAASGDSSASGRLEAP